MLFLGHKKLVISGVLSQHENFELLGECFLNNYLIFLSRFFDLYELPTDISAVDLDTNTISVSEPGKKLNISLRYIILFNVVIPI